MQLALSLLSVPHPHGLLEAAVLLHVDARDCSRASRDVLQVCRRQQDTIHSTRLQVRQVVAALVLRLVLPRPAPVLLPLVELLQL